MSVTLDSSNCGSNTNARVPHNAQPCNLETEKLIINYNVETRISSGHYQRARVSHSEIEDYDADCRRAAVRPAIRVLTVTTLRLYRVRCTDSEHHFHEGRTVRRQMLRNWWLQRLATMRSTFRRSLPIKRGVSTLRPGFWPMSLLSESITTMRRLQRVCRKRTVSRARSWKHRLRLLHFLHSLQTTAGTLPFGEAGLR